MIPEFSFVLHFLDSVFLQGDLFGIREGPLGSADPIIKGIIPSMLGILGFSIMLNLFNAGVRKKLIDTQSHTTKISDIANLWGFWHLGRFASYYQRQFSELPSETLKYKK